MLKELFNKDLFISSEYDIKAKKQSVILTIILGALFILSSLTFFNFMYSLCNAIGSFVSGSPDVAVKDILRGLLPILFSTLLSIFSLCSLHSLKHSDDDKRDKLIFKSAVAIISIATINILYVIIGVIVGIYDSFVEGTPSLLFPLDSVLYALLFIAIGVFGILYVKKWANKWPRLIAYNPIGGNKAKGLIKTLLIFWLLATLYGFTAFFYGIFIIDWNHGGVFYSLMLELLFILPFIDMIIWEFYLKELKDRKSINLLIPAIIGIAITVLVVVLYNVAYILNPQAPDLYCFGLLSVDYTASVNASTYVYVVVYALAHINFLIQSIILYKKNNTNNN